jgi:hypothetical protein
MSLESSSKYLLQQNEEMIYEKQRARRGSVSSAAFVQSRFWLFVSIPFVLLSVFGGLNVYLNWEHHYREISNFFDLDEFFDGVDIVHLTLLPGGQSEFHPEFPDDLREKADQMKAIVTSCHMLEYTGGENPSEDRPPHVRSASGLVWTHHDQLAVLQDDVNFLALVDIKELKHNYLSHYHNVNLTVAMRKFFLLVS